MNLENCVDNMGLEKIHATVHSSRRNLLINKSYSNLSGNLLGALAARKPLGQGQLGVANKINNSTNSGNNSNNISCMLVNSSSSHLNLYKSSNSLNALDLDLMESVSVGSFDRLSLYSCGGATSECDLNQCFLVEMIDDNDDFNNNDNNIEQQQDGVVRSRLNLLSGGGAGTNLKMRTSFNASNRTGGGCALVDNAAMSLSNLKENRVIDWLENI